MSSPQARKGRHAAPSSRGSRSAGILSGSIPHRRAGRRLAAAAAALTAGAVPPACAGSAAAATQADLRALGLPNLALPFGLPDSIDPLTVGVPIARDLPLSRTLSTAMPPLGYIAQVGDLGLPPERAPQAGELTGGVIGQAAPVASQPRKSGVPTVGDVTGELSGARRPMVGSVGSLTRTLPVTSVLGGDSPVTGALQNLGSL